MNKLQTTPLTTYQRCVSILPISIAILARITRSVTGRKGTPLERYLMDGYYKLEYYFLGENDE